MISYNKMQQGMVLLTLLVFLTILALLGITAFELGIMETHMANNQHSQLINFQSAESTLRFIEDSFAALLKPSCTYQVPLLETKGKDTIWWHNFACRGNYLNTPFYYYVEKIAQEDCAVLQETNKPAVNNHGVVYYRITTGIISESQGKASDTVLQSVVVKSATSNIKCVTLHTVLSGRQSWRKL